MCHRRQLGRLGSVGDVGNLVHDLVDAVQRAGRRLDLLSDGCERRHRAEHFAHHAHEGDQPADGQITLDDQP